MTPLLFLLACTPEPTGPTVVEPIQTTRSGPDKPVALPPEGRRLADGRMPLNWGEVSVLPAPLQEGLSPEVQERLLTASNQSYGACASCIEAGTSAADCYATCPVQHKVSRLAGRLLMDGEPDKVVLDSFKFKQGWVPVPELDGPSVPAPDTSGAELILWVVMDYESPFAADAWQAGLDIQAENPSLTLRPLYWHPERHENANLAARAAMAAGEQGKFKEMNALLLAPDVSLDRMSLVAMAEQLELDMGAFRAALVDAPVREKVQAHVNAGQQMGVRGMPCFFVNGWRIRGVPLPEQVMRLVGLEKMP